MVEGRLVYGSGSAWWVILGHNLWWLGYIANHIREGGAPEFVWSRWKVPHV